MLRNTDAMGQFTAPQNTATSPMAAPKPAGKPKKKKFYASKPKGK